MSLVASKLPCGFVKSPNPISAVLHGEQGFVRILAATSESIALPAGEWRLLSYRIDRTPPNERKIPIQVGPFPKDTRTYLDAGGTGTTPTTRVTEGNTVPLAFGPPYRALVKRRGQQDYYPSSGGTEMLSLNLIGSASEVCTNVKIHGSNPPQPSFTIASTEGEIVERGTFEYG